MIVFDAFIAGFLMFGALSSLCSGNYLPAGIGFITALLALFDAISENQTNNVEQQIKVLNELEDILKGKK